MTEAEIRQRVAEWSRQRIFRARDLSQRMGIESVLEGSVRPVDLLSWCERRTIQTVQRPYRGEAIGPAAQTDIWAVAVPDLRPFEAETQRLGIPGSEAVRTCSECSGKRSVACPDCRGSSKVKCPEFTCSFGRCMQCNGMGTINCSACGGTGTQPDYAKGGGERQTCVSCGGRGSSTCIHCVGIGRCRRCHGMGTIACTKCCNGSVTCPECDGAGRLLSYDELTVTTFELDEHEIEVGAGVTAPPAAAALRAAGRQIALNEASEVTPQTMSTTGAPACLQQLQAQTSARLKDDARVLRQRISVTEVPVVEVKYVYGAAPARTMWLIGTDHRVCAPGAPADRWRVLAAAVAALALVAATVLSVLLSKH